MRSYSLNLDVRFFIGPLASFLLEFLALVDDKLAIVANVKSPTFQRARRRAFKVDARNVEAAAVAWTFEFLLAFQPLRRAAEVSASRAQGVNRAEVFHD